MSGKPLSYLDLVNIGDNVHLKNRKLSSPFDSEKLIPLHLSEDSASPAIGLLRPIIVEQLEMENVRSWEKSTDELWSISDKRVSLRSWLDTPTKRTEAMKELCERWRDTDVFPDVCGPKKWRSELYPVYRDPFGVRDHPSTSNNANLNFAFEIERSACALFGIVTYGVHMSAFQEREIDDARRLYLWVPTRARTKSTWPGYLDNTVAGGIPSGLSAFEALVKECMEEASIAAEVVRKHVLAVGAISYFFRLRCNLNHVRISLKRAFQNTSWMAATRSPVRLSACYTLFCPHSKKDSYMTS
ncbi:hypothetical protein AX14_011536 [Amanita brunnescens Koide BX004]|nr:hypothetical protein AX14_011536 [Amanita brunnescens Koide BX004]